MAYLGPSPVTIAQGGTSVTSVTTAPTATSFAGWDANKNLTANNLIQSYTTTATAAGTTTLTVGSTAQQYFTGVTTQTVRMPVTSTLVLGQQFTIVNNSTGIVTVQSSGANVIQAMPSNTTLTLTVINTAVTTAAGWESQYTIPFFTVAQDGSGQFTTIAAALTAATAGTDILIKAGTYTENPTLKAGVNLVGQGGDQTTPNVIILGTCTMTVAGTCSISNIQLKTNGSFAVSITGSAATTIFLENCFIFCQNSVGLNQASTNASAKIEMNYCNVDTGGATTAIYTMSSPGFIVCTHCNHNNAGGTTTPSSNSAGVVIITFVSSGHAYACTGTGSLSMSYVSIGTPGNTPALNFSGTGYNTMRYVQLFCGSGVAATVGAGTTLILEFAVIGSTAANVLTGGGILRYAFVCFESSSGKNVTTTTAFTTI